MERSAVQRGGERRAEAPGRLWAGAVRSGAQEQDGGWVGSREERRGAEGWPQEGGSSSLWDCFIDRPQGELINDLMGTWTLRH